jgi:NADP-dependent 3-hydroxy acid dehydrogenase YdfG
MQDKQGGQGGKDLKDRVVVITGASAGIGAALADSAGRKGARLVLVARRKGALADVAARADADTQVLTVVADVTRRADVERAFDAALARFGQVDVWVNNAGRGITRAVSDLTDQDFDDMMAINVKSVLYGMQVVLPHFRARGTGHIINVSSMLGRVPFASFRSAYSAAKHAMNSLTANLRMELRGSHPGIHVSAVHPGIVATEFGTNALHGGPDSRQLPYAQSVVEVADVIAGVIENPRADVYTRDGARQMVAAYFAAEDMGAAEMVPPFVVPRS